MSGGVNRVTKAVLEAEVRSFIADMERAAGALWGSQLRQHVPPLRSRHVPRRKKPRAPVAPTG